jgi:hypothetical protein
LERVSILQPHHIAIIFARRHEILPSFRMLPEQDAPCDHHSASRLFQPRQTVANSQHYSKKARELGAIAKKDLLTELN